MLLKKEVRKSKRPGTQKSKQASKQASKQPRFSLSLINSVQKLQNPKSSRSRKREEKANTLNTAQSFLVNI